MNSPVSVGTRISTMAYTYMGIELIISGIITIAMHYGIANGNPQAAFVYYSATLSLTTQFPVWGGAIVNIKDDVFELIVIILIPRTVF